MKTILSIIFPTTLVLITVFSSCSKTNEEDLVLAAEQDTIVSCAPEGIYSTEVKPILDQYCITCHAPGGVVDYIPLASYTDAVSNSGTMMATLNHEAGVLAMPKNADKLSDCEILTVWTWIDAGTPDN